MPATTATATAASTRVWAIKCSRESILEEDDIHEDMFIDAHGDEQDAVKHMCEESATAFDGTWLWNSDPARFTCDKTKKSSSSSSSSSGSAPSGQLVVFSSLEAANAQAAKVWASMLCAIKEPVLPLHDQLGISLASKKQRLDTAGAPDTAAAAAAGGGGGKALYLTDEQLASSGRAETRTDGRALWQAEVQLYDRPFGTEANLVFSTLSVEVVPAQLVS